jgi:O-antigen/teichoic acid export membrane protein
MQRKFITNLALLLFLNLLIKPFWILGIDREVQVVVGAENFGLYYALFNFSFLFNSLLDIGITNFNNKNIAQNSHLLTKHFSNIIGLKIGLALLYSIVTIIIAFIIGYRGGEIKMLLILIFNQFLISLVLYLRSNISGMHFFKTDSILSVMDRLIMIVITAFLLWSNAFSGQYQIEWFIYTQTAGYGLTALIAFIIVFNKADSFHINVNVAFCISILKQSYPFALLILFMMIYNKADTIIMERILPDGAQQTGIFAQAYRLLDAANMIGFLFAGLLLPLFARMIKLKENIGQLVRLSCSLILTLSVISAAASFFYRHEIMDLLYDEHIEESANVFGILMFSFVAIGLTYIFGTLLTANGNLKQLNWLAFFAMVLNISLNFFLIPKYLAVGAAISGVVTNFTSAIIQIFLCGLIFKLKLNNQTLTSILSFIIGVLTLGYFSTLLELMWVYSFILMISGSVALAFITKLLSIKGIYHIIKYD